MGIFSSSVIKRMKKRVEAYKPELSVVDFFKQNGLPIDDDVLLGLMLCDNGIVIIDNSHEFIIKLDQIQKAEYNVRKETEKEIKTSTAKGIAGGVLFGAAGAVIGSQPKQKTITKISYTSSKGKASYIEFNHRTLGAGVPIKMKEFEKRVNAIVLKNKIPESGRIEL